MKKHIYNTIYNLIIILYNTLIFTNIEYGNKNPNNRRNDNYFILK